MPQTSSLPSRVRPDALARWLWIVAALVVAIVVVGGITRLTDSGLSMTRWQPVSGIVPPLDAAQWQTEFEHYKQFPQYRELNRDMTLGGFQAIFFWEYLHRFMGRLIGLAYLVPLTWFAVRRRIPSGYRGRLIALFLLIALQGTFGWLMVRSGLDGRTSVAPGWLATHLLTALFTLAGLVWTALDLRALGESRLARPARLTGLGFATGAVLFVQILYGALMAGLRAGLVSDSWPLMNGRFFPGASGRGESLGTLLFDDPAVVHFIHRWWAFAVFAVLVVLARAVKPIDRRASVAIHVTVGAQILLGIATVTSGVEIAVAVAHQANAALALIAAAVAAHRVGRRAR